MNSLAGHPERGRARAREGWPAKPKREGSQQREGWPFKPKRK